MPLLSLFPSPSCCPSVVAVTLLRAFLTPSHEPPVQLYRPCCLCEWVKMLLGYGTQRATLGWRTCSLWSWPAAHRSSRQASRRGRAGRVLSPRVHIPVHGAPHVLQAWVLVGPGDLGSSDWGLFCFLYRVGYEVVF